MIEPKDLSVKIALNYQGFGQCKLKPGRITIDDGLNAFNADVKIDYDEEEDDSIVCLNVAIVNTPLPTVLAILTEWTKTNLRGFEPVSTEVHCSIKDTKINDGEAIDIKNETNAWQLDKIDGLYTFIYFDEDTTAIPRITKAMSNRLSTFWSSVDSNINI